MFETVALVAALFGVYFVGVLQGKQWGAESVADTDALQWRDNLVARIHDDPADWQAHIGPQSVLRIAGGTDAP